MGVDMSRTSLTCSLEGDINGVAGREIEYTFYAKLKDLGQLDKAPRKEVHEQWTIPLDTDKPVKARLRLIDNRRYTMAVKNKLEGQIGVTEVEDDISADMFRFLRLAGKDGYKKTRYTFPIPGTGLNWEIDVFLDQSGHSHPWVKIDLEVEGPETEIPEFPVDIEELILQNGPDYTSSQEHFVRKLWDVEWSKLDGNGILSKDGV